MLGLFGPQARKGPKAFEYPCDSQWGPKVQPWKELSNDHVLVLNAGPEIADLGQNEH